MSSPVQTVIDGLKILRPYLGSVIGLDKHILVGPCAHDCITGEDAQRLIALGWEYDREQESWSLYTGHG
jgi:hypothetical protein